jgi:hypothetical protein
MCSSRLGRAALAGGGALRRQAGVRSCAQQRGPGQWRRAAAARDVRVRPALHRLGRASVGAAGPAPAERAPRPGPSRPARLGGAGRRPGRLRRADWAARRRAEFPASDPRWWDICITPISARRRIDSPPHPWYGDIQVTGSGPVTRHARGQHRQPRLPPRPPLTLTEFSTSRNTTTAFAQQGPLVAMGGAARDGILTPCGLAA